jgi:hypothetical protein
MTGVDAAGFAIEAGSLAVTDWTPWLALFIGVVMAGLGFGPARWTAPHGALPAGNGGGGNSGLGSTRTRWSAS